MVSKDTLNWTAITEKNISECLKVVANCEFKQLELSNDIEEFILSLSVNHSCDPKVLFFVILAGIGHFGESMYVYNLEAKQLKPISVYEVLIAPSGMYSSQHHNEIRPDV